jgi:hypothetical protein
MISKHVEQFLINGVVNKNSTHSFRYSGDGGRSNSLDHGVDPVERRGHC